MSDLRLGLTIFGVIALIGLSAPLWAPYDANEQVDPLGGRLRPPLTSLDVVRLHDGRSYLADEVVVDGDEIIIDRRGRIDRIELKRVANLSSDGTGVTERHRFLLGSDLLGRDVLSRWAIGAHISLLIGILSVALAMTVGVLVGAMAALGPRWVDGLLMRGVDGLLAFPTIFLLLAIAAVAPRGTWVLILLLGGTGWMGVSRLARAEISSLAQRDFVLAARGLGATETRILFRHILPNVFTPLLVAATFRIGSTILAEAALSYLQLGVEAPDPSWGNMISAGRDVLSDAWWIASFPSLGLIFTVASVTFVADGFRDALDPRHVS
ncbi:MAG: ABC transporter permease [Thermoanaerobaculia bacterium]|nr:ABC transporter permease [Thermoanaerobaculia bacterium]